MGGKVWLIANQQCMISVDVDVVTLKNAYQFSKPSIPYSWLLPTERGEKVQRDPILHLTLMAAPSRVKAKGTQTYL